MVASRTSVPRASTFKCLPHRLFDGVLTANTHRDLLAVIALHCAIRHLMSSICSVGHIIMRPDVAHAIAANAKPGVQRTWYDM